MKDKTNQKVPKDGLGDIEFREKQSKFNNSLFLLEHGLSDVIKMEKNKYNKWRRDQDKADEKEKNKKHAFRKNMTMKLDRSKSPKKEDVEDSMRDQVSEFDIHSVPFNNGKKPHMPHCIRPDFDEEN